MTDTHNRERRLLLSRRDFLGLTGVSVGALLLGTGALSGNRALALPSFLGYPFTLGVASGDPAPDGFVLWTRLAPDPFAPDGAGGMPAENFGVRYEVAEDEGFTRIVRRGAVEATPELGHAVHAEIGGLAPAAWYYYRFKAGPEVSPVGRARTAPAPGAAVPALRFAFASCQQWQSGYYTAYRRMAEEDLDVVFHLGDYIYEGTINSSGPRPTIVPDAVRPEPMTLAQYRLRHALYRLDPDLQRAHAAFPFVMAWDDHEVENNWAGPYDQNGSPPEAFLPRRAAAFQAYYEHMPLRRSSLPQGPDMRLYRAVTFGNLAQFHVLDTRQYRSDQACGDGTDIDCMERLDPARTITGPEQERWLLDTAAASATTWNVLAQQVFFAQRDFEAGSPQRFSMDAWDGYKASRDRVLSGIIERRVRNPVVLTGDVHANYAADLKANFDDPASATVGSEFVGTSISSGGDGSDTSTAGQTQLAENPHLKFYNRQRGYVRCAVTPTVWRADYRVLPEVRTPDAAISTRKSFVIENGRPGLQEA